MSSLDPGIKNLGEPSLAQLPLIKIEEEERALTPEEKASYLITIQELMKERSQNEEALQNLLEALERAYQNHSDKWIKYKKKKNFLKKDVICHQIHTLKKAGIIGVKLLPFIISTGMSIIGKFPINTH